MNPNSFSASSLDVAAQCPARYKAEFIDRGKDFQGSAANTGIVCHGTFEDFLRFVFIKKTIPWSDFATFRRLFEENYSKVFSSRGPEYDDAWDLCERWYTRPGLEDYLHDVKVLSLESKLSYELPLVADGKKITKPFNYIMDRVDRVAPGHYRVVDYKSNRVALTEEQLFRKGQARYYALMIQIRFKDAEKIEVEFDYLRHKPVRVEFTRDDNAKTWRELKQAAQKVLDTPDNRAPEILNPNCGWCVRKVSCKTLQKNIAAGGIMSKEVDDLAELYNQLTLQQKGQKELMAQIEMMILSHAAEIDELDFETETARVTVVAPQRRKVNQEWVAAVLGGDALAHANFSVTAVDNLLKKNSPLNENQKALLKSGAFEYRMGDPTVKIEPKEF